MHNDDQLDKQLDDALKNYVEEPRAGLELRVMNLIRAEAQAEVRTDEPHPSVWFPSWARWTALAAIACTIVVVAVFVVRRTAAPTKVARRPAPAIKQDVPDVREIAPPTAVATTTRRHHHAATVATHVDPRPRLEQFPAPTPLTADEIALLAWARRASPASQAALAGALKDKIEPIQIGEIKIPPLEGGDQ